MNAHLLRFRVPAERLDDLRPNRTHRAQFRNLEEEVRAHGEPEHDLRRRVVNREPALTERTQIRRRRCERGGNLLHVVRTAVAVNIAAYKYGFDMRRVLHRPFCRRRHCIILCAERRADLAACGELADGVGADDAAHARHILPCRTACRRDEREDREHRRACIDIERKLPEIEPLEQRVHIVDCRHARAEVTDMFRLARVDAFA